MKLKYIIPFFAAVIALLTGCKSDNDAIYLDGLNVSTSYVSLDKNGGTTQIFVSSADAWSFDAASIPAWLTVSPLSGSAGETTVSFSAEAYAGRDANTWGNARFVANLLEHIYLAHAKRCVNYAFAEDAPTIKKCFTITPADVQPIDVPKPKPHVGF